jgi:hypothetical protein
MRSSTCTSRVYLIYFSYFLISFLACTIFLFSYSSIGPEDTEDVFNPQVCSEISSVSSIDRFITVSYKRRRPSIRPPILSGYFGLITDWLEQQITFRLGSGNVSILNSTAIAIEFYYPVVDFYDALLTCGMKSMPGTPQVDSISANFSVTVNITDFVPSTAYSQLRCHHKTTFGRRWCEFRNIAYFDRHFVHFSPAAFDFPHPFIVPGARAPPFDKTETQLREEPLVVPFNLSEIPRSLEVIDDFCYIYGVFHNYYMLWHTVFDFMIPLYNFMKLLNRSETQENRRVYVRSDGVWVYGDLMRVFSKHPVQIIDEVNPTILMPKGVIGIEKLEQNADPHRRYDESIGFHYDINRSHALGMREELLRVLGVPDHVVGKAGKPLVLFIDRGSDSRNLVNTEEVKQVMIDGCPHCLVEVVQLHNMDVPAQMRLISRASVLAGLHGSGLANVVWLAESRANHTTHLLEFAPYKYTCRDWYQTAASAAGVNYHVMMNQRSPSSGQSSGSMERCWTRPEICATMECHDRLRDQKTTVELDTFKGVWREIADALKTTVVTETI